jgi:hypothetical protein
MLLIAFPIKWLFATFFSVSIYTFTVIGIPWNFNNINGNIRNKTGIAKLIMGDNTCTTDSDCRNDCDSLNGFNISQSK